ncbi:hypothetical protein E2M54_24270 [Salmonella enterica subsp. enterica serovar Nima]|nr:hypothetical protein [Salmonella enterica subsp. enterica serovar Vitkin]EBV3838424.1 hypothetical protein [Salmonella enterica subsp. enterica serovar Cotham]ECF3332097.1 hypothetical protein [Salmonella enterica subsp. enterica serovar Nima]EDR9973175.1 hypothetical protein [Salmonella enterica subsp. houtenae]ECH9295190.1 hypothetical protein [Salmonella enterica subsp. enterica serovar Vitkin]
MAKKADLRSSRKRSQQAVSGDREQTSPVRARQGFSGFRGAALNQSRSASGVYTGLVWWHEQDYQERPWQECLQHQCVRRLMSERWI